jgi:SulP family sulfate permease
LRIEGSIYFGAVNHVDTQFDALRETRPDQKHLLLLAKSINFIDVAGAELLAHEAYRRRKMGGQLYFYSMRQPVRDMLERSGRLDEIGRDNVFAGKYEAISGVFARLDRSICRTCRARVFNECASVPPVQD